MGSGSKLGLHGFLGSAAVLKQEKYASVKKSKHRGETGTFRYFVTISYNDNDKILYFPSCTVANILHI